MAKLRVPRVPRQKKTTNLASKLEAMKNSLSKIKAQQEDDELYDAPTVEFNNEPILIDQEKKDINIEESLEKMNKKVQEDIIKLIEQQFEKKQQEAEQRKLEKKRLKDEERKKEIEKREKDKQTRKQEREKYMKEQQKLQEEKLTKELEQIKKLISGRDTQILNTAKDEYKKSLSKLASQFVY